MFLQCHPCEHIKDFIMFIRCHIYLVPSQWAHKGFYCLSSMSYLFYIVIASTWGILLCFFNVITEHIRDFIMFLQCHHHMSTWRDFIMFLQCHPCENVKGFYYVSSMSWAHKGFYYVSLMSWAHKGFYYVSPMSSLSTYWGFFIFMRHHIYLTSW